MATLDIAMPVYLSSSKVSKFLIYKQADYLKYFWLFSADFQLVLSFNTLSHPRYEVAL